MPEKTSEGMSDKISESMPAEMSDKTPEGNIGLNVRGYVR